MARHRTVNPDDGGSSPPVPAIAGSSNGRTAAFGAVNLGSNPSPAANEARQIRSPSPAAKDLKMNRNE